MDAASALYWSNILFFTGRWKPAHAELHAGTQMHIHNNTGAPHFHLPSFFLVLQSMFPPRHGHLVHHLSDWNRPSPPWSLSQRLFTSTPPLVRDNRQRLTYQRFPATLTHSLVRRQRSGSPRTPSPGPHAPSSSALLVGIHARLAPRSQPIVLSTPMVSVPPDSLTALSSYSKQQRNLPEPSLLNFDPVHADAAASRDTVFHVLFEQ